MLPPMTIAEREQMKALCDLIASEKDPEKFTRLIEQLDVLLTSKELRLDEAKQAFPRSQAS